MPPELFALFMFVLVVLAIVLMTWFFRKSRSLLDGWAADNDYTIISYERRYFRRGPYFWSTSNGQDVYRVTIRTVDGSTHSGYVRCGGFFAGMLSDKVTVEWD